MSKLQTMESVVLEILEQNKGARKDDYYLIYLVCEKLNPDINDMSFGRVMYNPKGCKMPNWETITRVRRKIQEKRPDLVAPETARKRVKEEQEYREYARS